MITGIGGAGKIIGGGSGIGIDTWTSTLAMDVSGKKTMIVNKNILKICFFIGLPPLHFYETIHGNLYAISEKKLKMSFLLKN
jgi:hypothetical protein